MRPSAMACLSRPGLTMAVVPLLFALAACGGAKESDQKQVEMRDMDVVDGTINDSMTNLDAVRGDGTALANSSGTDTADRPASRAGQREARDAVDEAEANAETVAED